MYVCPVRPIITTPKSDLCQIFMDARTAALDDESEISFLIRQRMLPRQQVSVGFIHRTEGPVKHIHEPCMQCGPRTGKDVKVAHTRLPSVGFRS